MLIISFLKCQCINLHSKLFDYLYTLIIHHNFDFAVFSKKFFVRSRPWNGISPQSCPWEITENWWTSRGKAAWPPRRRRATLARPWLITVDCGGNGLPFFPLPRGERVRRGARGRFPLLGVWGRAPTRERSDRQNFPWYYIETMQFWKSALRPTATGFERKV